MFLKKMVLNGFKSFGTKTEINFTKPVTGVIGPNGSGKSNIIDAIKWVLGEKSNKALRGKISTDVIFKGSKNSGSSDFAEVTLYFDNSSKLLHYSDNTVIVTRKISTESSENEYYINNEPCRLKDIQEIFLDSGLSKESLGIIGQGTVQWFVEAKPEDRRHIFEEAAGIGLYSKKKEESANQLTRAEENLRQITTIVNELNRDIVKISKQAEKAKIFSEKKKELTKIELNILVKDIKYYGAKLDSIKSEYNKAKITITNFKHEIDSQVKMLDISKSEFDQNDANLEGISAELMQISNKLSLLEARKNNIKSSLEDEINSDQVEKKIRAYKELISTTNFEITNAKEQNEKILNEINTYLDIGGASSKAYIELQDKLNAKTNRLNEVRIEIRSISSFVNGGNNLESGVKAIVENKSIVHGYCGLVKDFFKVDTEYEKAIGTALGKSINNVIVETSYDAENAVNLLKTNKSGKATFLPLDTIKAKYIKDEFTSVLPSIPGYIGVASDLIETSNKYDAIFKSLLGTTIIANTIADANLISRYSYKQYRVISLDGDVINPGGSITGGYNKSSTFFANPKETLENLEKECTVLEDEVTKLRVAYERNSGEVNELNAKINERKVLRMHYDEVIRNGEEHLMDYETELSKYTSDTKASTNSDLTQTLNEEIASLSSKKQKLSMESNVNRQNKSIAKSKMNDYEAKIEDMRFQLDKSRAIASSVETDVVRCENVINISKEKINNTYKMTIDYAIAHFNEELPISDVQAREVILNLQHELDALGAINFDAIKELDEKQERYNMLSKEQKELQDGVDKIAEAIAKLDDKAKQDFAIVIDKVNERLPAIFNYLFGGGECHVALSNPNDYLTSGVDVMAQLPGKNMVHLNLLSGGEKTLVALSILFSILKIKTFPLIVLDEAESALDPANVERFGNIIKENSDNTQFMVITHRPGTMEHCDVLYGATMQAKGITSVYSINLQQASEIVANDSN